MNDGEVAALLESVSVSADSKFPGLNSNGLAVWPLLLRPVGPPAVCGLLRGYPGRSGTMGDRVGRRSP